MGLMIHPFRSSNLDTLKRKYFTLAGFNDRCGNLLDQGFPTFFVPWTCLIPDNFSTAQGRGVIDSSLVTFALGSFLGGLACGLTDVWKSPRLHQMSEAWAEVDFFKIKFI